MLPEGEFPRRIPFDRKLRSITAHHLLLLLFLLFVGILLQVFLRCHVLLMRRRHPEMRRRCGHGAGPDAAHICGVGASVPKENVDEDRDSGVAVQRQLLAKRDGVEAADCPRRGNHPGEDLLVGYSGDH